MRLIKTMREQRKPAVDVREEIDDDPSTSMCSAFMDTFTSMDLLMLSDAVRDGQPDIDVEAEAPVAVPRKALRTR
jgi:hypothetical protein